MRVSYRLLFVALSLFAAGAAHAAPAGKPASAGATPALGKRAATMSLGGAARKSGAGVNGTEIRPKSPHRH